MKLTINLDNLDEAIRQLEELEWKLREFPHDVAKESADNIRYKNATTYVVSMDGENQIRVNGDQVAFQEYGAGFEADFDHIGNIPTYPGVWSDDHEGTFKKWLYYNHPEENYKYNRTPQRKIRTEVERLKSQTESKAEGYFK